MFIWNMRNETMSKNKIWDEEKLIQQLGMAMNLDNDKINFSFII